jgi:hypothetical protein
VEINGMMLAMLDIPAWCTEEYNRWYDLDHLPEHVSKGDVLMGRRYVAPSALRATAGVQRSDWVGGYAPYLTTYWFGGPLDFTSDEAAALWRDKDRIIVKAGRYWRDGRGRHNSRWWVADAVTRPSVLVDKAAVPYLAHQGVIVAIGRAASPERVQEAVDWWDRVHLVDLFAVPGLLAAVRLRPVDPSNQGLLLHMLLCEDPPAEVMAGIERAMRYLRAVGRFPAHGGVYESMAFLPYQWIVPLHYDFDIGEPDDAAPAEPVRG